MTTPMREGDCIRHTADGFVGLHAGFTRLHHLMERPSDLRGVRVSLPDGTIRIASEHNLEAVEFADYERYATRIGVQLKGRRPTPLTGRS